MALVFLSIHCHDRVTWLAVIKQGFLEEGVEAKIKDQSSELGGVRYSGQQHGQLLKPQKAGHRSNLKVTVLYSWSAA